jgi:LPXTG-site transpeptidase (sortase) family protein
VRVLCGAAAMSIRPIVLRTPGPAPESPTPRVRHVRAWAQDVVFVSVCALAGVVTLLAGYNLYLQLYEWRSPSGEVYIETGGSRVYLVQPTAVVTPPVSVASTDAQPAQEPAVVGQPTPGTDRDTHSSETRDDDVPLPPTVVGEPRAIAPTPRTDVPLPPTGLLVPAIGVDVDVRMTTSDNLPRGPYAGWFFRSAFPATAGNVVLLGHVDGEAAIFGRLNELRPGDEVRVSTARQVHVYVVEWTAFVGGSAVEMLGPIDHPVLTLITCAGEWDADRREYRSRTVVRARYAAVEERVASY